MNPTEKPFFRKRGTSTNQIPINEELPDQFRFGDEKREWLAGGIFAFLGTIASVGFLVRTIFELFDSTLDKFDFLRSLPGVAMGLLFAYIGYWFLLWKDEVSFDLTSCVYRRKRGWGPWAKLQQGHFSDFECIRLKMKSSKGGRLWHVSLHWKALGFKCPEFELFKYRDSVQATAEASRLGAALEIAVDASAVEAQQQIDSLENAKQLAWKQKLRPYKVGLVTLFVLLIINALVPGIHWRDSWSDEGGRVFERRSTLFHTLTRVESAGQPIGFSDMKLFVIGHSSHTSGFFAARDVPATKKLNYHWSIGAGPFPRPEDSISELGSRKSKP